MKYIALLVTLGVVLTSCNAGPPPEDIIVDNTDPGCTVEGAWAADSRYPHHGDDYLYARMPIKTGGTIRVTWEAEIPKSGDYEVFIRWPGDKPTDRASNALYLLEHAQGLYKFHVNQKDVSLANTWVSVGAHPFKKNGAAKVVLSNEGANHNVAADAVKWVYKTKDEG